MKRELVRRFGKHINQGQIAYLRAGHLDVVETERTGIRFKDPFTGRVMIDCFTSAGCFNVGRHNPAVLQALDEALDVLDMGDCHHTSRQKLALAEELVSMAPGDLSRVFFASGGGDAIDGAIKLARAATGRPQILSTVKAYHGHTGFAISANGKEHYRKFFEPLMPGFRFAPFNDLEAMRRLASEDVAGIIVEPVQGEAGIIVADPDYLAGLRALCDSLGIFLIFDEVQTGFGRTGKMFACEHSGVVPDLLVVAKSLSGGIFPNGAVLYRPREEILRLLEKTPAFHPSTSGGSDIACHVSLRVLQYLRDTHLPENAARVGARLKEKLEKIRSENPRIIREVRGIGLMLGIEYLHEFMGPMMSDSLAKRGVFAAYSGNAPQVMRFMLPLIATEEDVDEVGEALRSAVEDMKVLLPIALPAARVPGVLRLLNQEKVQTVVFGGLRSLEDLWGRMRGKGREGAT